MPFRMHDAVVGMEDPLQRKKKTLWLIHGGSVSLFLAASHCQPALCPWPLLHIQGQQTGSSRLPVSLPTARHFREEARAHDCRKAGP